MFVCLEVGGNIEQEYCHLGLQICVVRLKGVVGKMNRSGKSSFAFSTIIFIFFGRGDSYARA